MFKYCFCSLLILLLLSTCASVPSHTPLENSKKVALSNESAASIYNDDLNKAMKILNELIQVDPKFEYAYQARSYCYWLTGDFALAATDNLQAIKLNTENSINYFNYGNTLVGLHDDMAAISAFTKAIEKNPEFYDSYYNRANALLRIKDLNNALSDYKFYVAKTSVNLANIWLMIHAIETELANPN